MGAMARPAPVLAILCGCALGAVATPLLASCYQSHRRGDSGGVPPDAAGDDGGSPPPTDGGPLPFDAGRRDGGPLPFDAGRRDGGPLPFDASSPDAGRPDAGARDAGRRDAGRRDAGPRSVALAFRSGQRLVVAPAPTLDLAGDSTLELWVRPRADGSISVKGDRTTRRFHFSVELVGGQIGAGFAAETEVRQVLEPIATGVWSHVCVTLRVSGSTVLLRLLVNGFPVAAGTFPNELTATVNDSPLVFGGFDGDLDEIRIWDFVRADDVIRADMMTRISGAAPGLVAYWPLEEGGQLALDHTARGHDAVLGALTLPDPSDPTWIRDGPI